MEIWCRRRRHGTRALDSAPVMAALLMLGSLLNTELVAGFLAPARLDLCSGLHSGKSRCAELYSSSPSRRGLVCVGVAGGPTEAEGVTTMASGSRTVQDLVEAGKAAEALAALQELEGPSGAGAVSEVVYESVVRCCAENRQWQLALQAIRSLSSRHRPQPKTYRTAIQGCIKAGDRMGAQRVYEAMISAGVMPDAETLEAVLPGLPSGVDGMSLVEEARLRYHLPPTKKMYRIIIQRAIRRYSRPAPQDGKKGQGGNRNMAMVHGGAAAMVAEELSSKQYRLGETAIMVLMEEVAKQKRVHVKDAGPVLDLFLRDADSSFSDAAFLCAISLAKQAHALEKGRKILRKSQKYGKVTVLAYNMVMKIAEGSREPRRALTLLKEMKETDGLTPDIISYNTAISACAKAGLPEEALRLLDEIEREGGLEPNLLSFNSVVDALAHTGRWKEAMEVMNTLYRRGLQPDVITYTGLITACSRGGQPIKALTFLDSMKMAGIAPDAVAYSAAVEACARGGLNDEAETVVQQMKNEGLRPTAQVYRALIQAGAMTIEKVWNTLSLLPKHEKNNYVYCAAINACEREGNDWAMAMKFFDDMASAGIVADDVTITALLRVLAHAGRWEEALQVFSKTRKRNVRHYTAVIQACGVAGHATAGLEVFQEMRERRVLPDTVTYNGLFQACRSEPESLASKALGLYRTMRDEDRLKPDIVTYTLLIGTLEKGGMEGESLSVFEDGVNQGILLKSYLDDVYEKDLSKLSFQLIRPAVLYTLQNLRRHHALHGSSGVEDLVLITGVDRHPPPGATETRAQLAQAVLSSQGLLREMASKVQGDAGIVRVSRRAVTAWLEAAEAGKPEAPKSAKKQKPPQHKAA